jgi:hypothetical protein
MKRKRASLRTESRQRAMMRAAVIFVLTLCSAEAADQFPLTGAAWQRLRELKRNQQFYTSCFAVTGPAGDLADVISQAHAIEGSTLARSECAGDTPITPEDIFQLGMMYCQRKPLNGAWAAIESAIEKCVGRKARRGQ